GEAKKRGGRGLQRRGEEAGGKRGGCGKGEEEEREGNTKRLENGTGVLRRDDDPWRRLYIEGIRYLLPVRGLVCKDHNNKAQIPTPKHKKGNKIPRRWSNRLKPNRNGKRERGSGNATGVNVTGGSEAPLGRGDGELIGSSAKKKRSRSEAQSRHAMLGRAPSSVWFELPPVSAAWEQVGKPATRGKALPRHYHASLVLSSAEGMGRADDNKNAGSFTSLG
ncbi:hypothetical protein GW17_00054501, partial [Ensete ventricosum]